MIVVTTLPMSALCPIFVASEKELLRQKFDRNKIGFFSRVR